MSLDEMEDFSLAQVGALEEERLSDKVVGSVIEVLRLKSSTVYDRRTWIAFADDVLLSQLHPTYPRFLTAEGLSDS